MKSILKLPLRNGCSKVRKSETSDSEFTSADWNGNFKTVWSHRISVFRFSHFLEISNKSGKDVRFAKKVAFDKTSDFHTFNPSQTH